MTQAISRLTIFIVIMQILFALPSCNLNKAQLIHSFGQGNSDDHSALISWQESLPLSMISEGTFNTNKPQVAMNDSGEVAIVWQQYNGSDTAIFCSRFDGTAWHHPTSLADTISLIGASEPKVAINGAGKIIVVWSKYYDSTTKLYTSYYNGSSWNNSDSVSESIIPSGTNASNYNVKINNNDKIVITWTQSDTLNSQIFYSYYDGTTWDHPADLNDNISPDGQNADSSTVEINDNNQIIIAWTQSDGANSQIFYSHFNGTVWDHPLNLADNISPNASDLTSLVFATINESNEIIITWSQIVAGFLQIFYSHYDGAAWHHPADLNDNITNDATNAFPTNMSLNDSGHIVIVGLQLHGGGWRTMYSYYNGTVWDHPTNSADYISPAGSSVTVDPQVKINNNDKIIISWGQSDGNDLQMFYSYYNGTVWDHPADLNDNISPNDEYISDFHVAINNLNEIAITWSQENGTNRQIYLSKFDGTAWDHPADLDDIVSVKAQLAYDPKIAINDDGKILIAWYQTDGSNDQIYFSYYNGVTWDHPANIADYISTGSESIQGLEVAMNNNGQAVITWLHSDGANSQVYYSYYNGTTWTHPINTNDNISPDGEDAESINVAMNENGKIIIAWTQTDGSNNQLFYSYFNGTTWDHPADLNDNISQDGEDVEGVPSVAMNTMNQIALAWAQGDGSNTQLFYSYFDGSIWVHPANLTDNISPNGEDVENHYSIAINNTGKIIVSWVQGDGSDSQIYYSYYDGAVWDHPVDLTDKISQSGSDVEGVIAKINDGGKIIISWNQEDASGNAQVFASYFDGANWMHPSGLADFISPSTTLEIECDEHLPLLADDVGFIVMVCNDTSQSRIYVASMENNFAQVPVADYISLQSESADGLSGTIISDEYAAITYTSSINSTTQSPIRYITWE